MRLLLASESAVEKNCHGSSAANTRSGYGDGRGQPGDLAKMTVKMIIVSNGRSNAHATPMAVCL